MHREDGTGERFQGCRGSPRGHLLRVLEARRSFLAGDIEGAVSAYAELLDPRRARPAALLDLRRILQHLDQMAAADPEFGLARGSLRARLVELLMERD